MEIGTLRRNWKEIQQQKPKTKKWNEQERKAWTKYNKFWIEHNE